MNKLKEQLDIEKQQWIENYMKKQAGELLVKERQLREGVREARDQEIEMIIARFEQENSVNREESERAAENRIKYVNMNFKYILVLSSTKKVQQYGPNDHKK